MFTRFARLVSVVAALTLLTSSIAAADDPIAITASDGRFTPGTIVLKVGVPTTLRLSSTEGVHGVQSDELGISQTLIFPGKVTEVTLTPKKPGTYVIHCSVPCGSGHDSMTLTVKVES
ncbi:MAG TPA: cupredoxin domain-containing protein [Candidatus Aquilonibacter sp.]